MKVVIPLAGIGARLKPHTYTLPKPLIPVAGKPILGHILDSLARLPVEELILVTGYRGDQIVEYVRRDYTMPVCEVVQEQLHGLGYALHLAAPHFDGHPILIILGDTIIGADLEAFTRPGANRIGVHQVEDPRRFGTVWEEGGRIVGLEEKAEHPKSDRAIVGVYYIEQSHALRLALDEIMTRGMTTKGEYQLTDALQLLVQQGVELHAQTVGGWYDCGKPETLLATNQILLKDHHHYSHRPGNVILPPVYIPDSVQLEHSIVGPYVSIGEDAVVQHAIVRNSIVGDGVVLRDCLLEGSLIGNQAEFIGVATQLNVGDSSQVNLAREGNGKH